MERVLKQFDVIGKIISYEIYGEGHINDTYLVFVENENRIIKYILQKVNNNIFKDVPGLMNNIYLVTSFLKEQIIKANGNPDRETLNLVKTKDGQIYYSKDTQTLGAKFLTNAIIPGILMGDQDLKDYVNAPGYISVTSKDGQRYDIMSYISHMSENSSSEIKDDTVTPNEATTGDVIEEEEKYSFALTQYGPDVYADIIKEYQQKNPGFEPTGSETTDELKELSSGITVVPNIQTMIDGCIANLQNTQEGPVKTK